MKYLQLTMLSLIVVFAGCASIQEAAKDALTNEQKIAQAAKWIKTGTTVGVVALVKAKPETVKYLKITSTAINFAIRAQTFEPTALNNLIKERINDHGGAAFAPLVDAALVVAMTTYERFWSLNIKNKLEAKPALASFLRAIKEGIDVGTSLLSSSSGCGPNCTKPCCGNKPAEVPVLSGEPPTDTDLTLQF